jgi:hypothetical protein
MHELSLLFSRILPDLISMYIYPPLTSFSYSPPAILKSALLAPTLCFFAIIFFISLPTSSPFLLYPPNWPPQYSWVPHEKHVWVPAIPTGSSGSSGLSNFKSYDNESFAARVDLASLDKVMDTTLSTDVPNLVNLDEFVEGAIIHQLRTRYKKNEIYTSIGTILVSINPYQLLPIYTSSVVDTYRCVRGLGRSLDFNMLRTYHALRLVLVLHSIFINSIPYTAFLFSGTSPLSTCSRTSLVSQRTRTRACLKTGTTRPSSSAENRVLAKQRPLRPSCSTSRASLDQVSRNGAPPSFSTSLPLPHSLWVVSSANFNVC